MKLNLKKLARNPTKSREDSLISHLRKLERDKIIDESMTCFEFSRILELYCNPTNQFCTPIMPSYKAIISTNKGEREE